MIIRSKSTAVWWRTSIIGESLISIGYGTDINGPDRVRSQIGWSSQGQSIRKPKPASLSRSGVTRLCDIHGPIQPRGGRPPASGKPVAHVSDQAGLVLLPHLTRPLRIGAAVADVFVVARIDRL